MNIRFSYLYRDGGNYKQFHSEVYSNVDRVPIDTLEERLKGKLIDTTWFYPAQWNLQELRESFRASDPTWHEYESLELTDDEPTKGDIRQLLTL